jgi:16S rRNA (guanine527-N7)-methyltransferase
MSRPAIEPQASAPAAPGLAADRAKALALTAVSRETTERLDRFVALFLETQSHTNLVGPATVPELWTRHIADSLQLLDLAPDARIWLDLGSGGGFPGVVLACALAERPGAHVHLVESITKKATFLHSVGQALALPMTVHHRRIEDFSPDFTADVVTARALARLTALLGYVAPLLEKGAKALLPKGQDVEAELTEAAKYWNVKAELVASRTNPAGRIVVVHDISRRTGKSQHGRTP